ncbi:MAG: hypothetical protein PHQ43_01080 [Dehalococcoidales bacterium]|nr:hypothetical protein [Dehalococcoidales bacterium]
MMEEIPVRLWWVGIGIAAGKIATVMDNTGHSAYGLSIWLAAIILSVVITAKKGKS